MAYGKGDGERRPPREPGPRPLPAPVPEEIPGSDFPDDGSGATVETEMQDVAEGQAQVPGRTPTAPAAPAAPAALLPEPSGATPIQGTFSVPGAKGARPFVQAPMAGETQQRIGARIAPFLARDMRRPRVGQAGTTPETFTDLFGESAFASDLSRAMARRSRLSEG